MWPIVKWMKHTLRLTSHLLRLALRLGGVQACGFLRGLGCLLY